MGLLDDWLRMRHERKMTGNSAGDVWMDTTEKLAATQGYALGFMDRGGLAGVMGTTAMINGGGSLTGLTDHLSAQPGQSLTLGEMARGVAVKLEADGTRTITESGVLGVLEGDGDAIERVAAALKSGRFALSEGAVAVLQSAMNGQVPGSVEHG